MKTAEEIAFMYPASGGKMDIKTVYMAMEAYHAQFSQQPTEKTVEWTCKKCGYKLPNGVDFDMHVCQSDSVDADIEQEIENIIKDNINIAFKGEGRVVFDSKVCASLIARRFAGSKVKPVNEDGWIPVEKELPKHNVPVLIIRIEGFDTQIIDIGEHRPAYGGWYYKQSAFPAEVTHWQPLPKSPR